MNSSSIIASCQPHGVATTIYAAKRGLQGKDLTLSEAKSILRDIMTMCERQPHKMKLAEARANVKVH